ncbi:DUF4251 domain-containing protein [Winogradskyella sp. DF17]|uniref:DUF4251 domain-containing protein n=1 Tax=Winogradskyella pelagia TaxID=2819984 RepID=A0ABS3T684_9FLAO|nr:DUF4251 domain-containing protein [Winogradskyella sp. DF17]MBO3117804.1 DUF4251 domain-containing protein [Winogradskyella sp. DF17]
MAKKIFQIVVLCSISLFSCSSSKERVDKMSLEQLEQLMNLRLIEFSAESALPLLTTDVMKVNNALLSSRGDSPSRIMLDKGYYLKIRKDSSAAELPYFGEVRVANYDFGNNSNIIFSSTIRDLNIKNHKNKKLVVTYKIESGKDSYNIELDIFPSKSANLIINAVRRNQITYRGKVKFYNNLEDLQLRK